VTLAAPIQLTFNFRNVICFECYAHWYKQIYKNLTFTYEILSSHASEDVDSGFLGSDTMQQLHSIANQKTTSNLQCFALSSYNVKSILFTKIVLSVPYICNSKHILNIHTHIYYQNNTVSFLYMTISDTYLIWINVSFSTHESKQIGYLFSMWLVSDPMSLQLSITFDSPRIFINMHVTALRLPAKIFIVHQCVMVT
jgi:hypothetical protein